MKIPNQPIEGVNSPENDSYTGKNAQSRIDRSDKCGSHDEAPTVQNHRSTDSDLCK